jgi:hypothetical protein
MAAERMELTMTILSPEDHPESILFAPDTTNTVKTANQNGEDTIVHLGNF